MAKEVNKRVNVFINGKEVENNIKSIRAAMAQLTNQLNKMTIGSKEYNDTSEKLKILKKIYDDHVKSLKSTREEVENLSRSQKDNLLIAGAVGSAISGVNTALQNFISKTQQYVEAYATIDDAMSGVMKTTGMTREEVEALNESLKNIDTRTSQEELLTIAQIGGRMGLAKDQILDFTKAVDLANVALGDSFSGGAEEISSVLGKIALAFKETRDADIGESLTRIGSAINEVGSMANATEPNIAAFVQRVGAMPEAFRPSVQEAVALGAAFEESSIDAEVASRAFGIVMNKATTDVKGFAKVMKLPVEEVRALINTNPTKFFAEFAKSLNGLNAEQIGSSLKTLGLNADGVVKIVGAMSGSFDRFNEILQTSNSAFKENTSLANEFNTVNNNSAAAIEKARNKMEEARQEMGKQLIPILTKLYEVIGSVSKGVSSLSEWLMKHKEILGLLATATASYLLIITTAKITDRVTYCTKAIKLLNLEMKALGGTMSILGASAFFAAIFGGTVALKKYSEKLMEAKVNVEGLGEAYNKALEDSKKAHEGEDVIVTQLIEKINDLSTSREDQIDILKTLESYLPGYYDKLREEKEIYIDTKTALEDLRKFQELDERKQAVKGKISYLENAISEFENSSKGKRAKRQEERGLRLSAKAANGNPFAQIASALLTSNDDIGNQALQELQKYRNAIGAAANELRDIATEQLELENAIRGRNNDVRKEEIVVEGTGEVTGKELSSLKSKKEDFKKRMERIRTELSEEELEGWEKVRAKIAQKYKELQNEAIKLGLGSIYEEDIEKYESEEIENAAKKWVQKATDALNSAMGKANDLMKENDPTELAKDPITKAVEERSAVWDDMIKTAEDNLEVYMSLLKDIEENSPEYRQFSDAATAASDAIDEFNIKKAQDIANLVSRMKKELSDKDKSKKKEYGNVWEAILSDDYWKDATITWQEKLDMMSRATQEFANSVSNIFNSINQIQANREQAELNQFLATQDEKSKALQRQLDDGIISQKYYDAQMDKMQKEKEAKEKKIQHDQFEREKKANIIQATISGALAIVNALTVQPWVAAVVAAALTAATTAAQIAVIASQPNPYAKGGYIKGAQLALMGEQGDEWVASNKLLRDRQAAPVIAALESYQRGENKSLINALTTSSPSWENLSQSSRMISHTFASRSNGKVSVSGTDNGMSESGSILAELQQMNRYLSDPANRRAYITRKTQLDYENNESDIKQMARL